MRTLNVNFIKLIKNTYFFFIQKILMKKNKLEVQSIQNWNNYNSIYQNLLM